MIDCDDDFKTVYFEKTLADILAVYVQDDPVAILDLNTNSEEVYKTIGDTYCVVRGVDSLNLTEEKTQTFNVKYDFITIFGSLPADESKYELLQVCNGLVKDHGSVIIDFSYCKFNEFFDSINEFVKYVKECNFVIESYMEFWGPGIPRFVLKKNFGQGHCNKIKKLYENDLEDMKSV